MNNLMTLEKSIIEFGLKDCKWHGIGGDVGAQIGCYLLQTKGVIKLRKGKGGWKFKVVKKKAVPFVRGL